MTTRRFTGFAVALLAAFALATPALAQYSGGSNVLNKAKKTAKDTAHSHAHAHVNEAAPQFSLTDVRTGEPVALSDFSDKLVVLVWQSINCPWDKMRDDGGYQRVLSPLAEEWAANDVQFIAINSNKNESVEDIAAYASTHDIPYPILKDPGNKIADVYGAQTTPHFFVITPGDQNLVYMGGYEETPSSPGKAGYMDENYLQPVVLAALNGTPLPVTETKSKGCSIKRAN
ncbi:MAG: redoxin domain-containing protein [Planctomycetota bacterium]